MKKKLSVSLVLLFFSCVLAVAQEWSKEDSLWIRNIIEGKENLIINENTKKAIEDGLLIAPDRLKGFDETYELSRELGNTEAPLDSIRFSILNPYAMPPAVYALYALYIEKMDSIFHIESVMISPEERKRLEELLPTGTIQSIYFRTSDLSPGFGITADFNNLLSMVFSSKYRQLMRNKKNATAYKNYYDYGFNKPSAFSERERKQIIQSVNSIKRTSIGVSVGPRRGGIDD